jgi:hypothetical protein
LNTYDELKLNHYLWNDKKDIFVKCSWCGQGFDIKKGTLYNIIRRSSDGIYCNRKCAGYARTFSTQKRYNDAGGKSCKRCGEFKTLSEYSSLRNPPYYRAECKRCHNFKPARQYSLLKEKSVLRKISFHISLDDFLSISNSDCYYCGGEKIFKNLILINEAIGFTKNNTISCCRLCFKMKGDLEHHIFLNNCFKITNNIKKEVENE